MEIGIVERVLKNEEILKRRFTETHVCVICGQTDLSTQTILELAMFIPNEPEILINAALSHTMKVCSELCRKKYIASGLVPYAYLMEGVGIPNRFFGKRSDLLDKNKTISNLFKEWLTSLECGFYICGSSGTGKTTLAVSVAHELRKLEYRVKFYRSSDLAIRSNGVRNSDDMREFINEIDRYDILIIDDIVKHSLTKSGCESLYNIYSRLYDENKCVIFTSNYKINEVANSIDERLGSRIVEMCRELILAGKDKRLMANGENQNTGNQ